MRWSGKLIAFSSSPSGSDAAHLRRTISHLSARCRTEPAAAVGRGERLVPARSSLSSSTALATDRVYPAELTAPTAIATIWLGDDAQDPGPAALSEAGASLGWDLIVGVTSRVQSGRPEPEARAGIHRFLLTKRRPELTHERWAHHFVELHAPIVLAHAPGFTDYVANVTVRDDLPFDGISEQWFADLPTLEQHDRSIGEEHKRPVREDLTRFMGGFEQFFASAAG